MTNYIHIKNRILVDIDNERRYDCDILNLTKTDEVIDFMGDAVILNQGDYLYTFTENHEEGILSYIFAEGRVIRSPYEDSPCKWCLKLVGEIEYSEDYDERFKVD